MSVIVLAEVLVAWVSAAGFAIVLPLRAPVKTNPAVRSAFILTITIWAILTLTLAVRAFGWRLPAWAAAVVWGLIAAALVYQFIALLLARRRGARDRRQLNLGPSRRAGERRQHR